MANSARHSRSHSGGDSSRSKSRNGVSENSSHHSVRSTISNSDTDSGSLTPTASRRSKSSMERSKKRRLDTSHHMCFNVMNRHAEEVQKMVADREIDKARIVQLFQELRDKNSREVSIILRANSEKKTAIAEAERLTTKAAQLRQQLESTNATTQDQVAWDDIERVLHQTHGRLISAAAHFGNFIDALQNKRPASSLPGTEVFNGNWPAHGGSVGATDSTALPGFCGSSNPPKHIDLGQSS